MTVNEFIKLNVTECKFIITDGSKYDENDNFPRVKLTVENMKEYADREVAYFEAWETPGYIEIGIE